MHARYWQSMRAELVEVRVPFDELRAHERQVQSAKVLPRQNTERLPRCQFAPRMLHRARRPRIPHVSIEANASKDAEV